jgi:O-antigen/teichoic acid export membrane protein
LETYSTKNIKNAIFAVFSGNTARLMLQFIYFPIITRYLGKINFGDYSIIIAVITLGVAFFGFGVSIAINKFIAEYAESDDLSRKKSALYTLIISIISFAIVISIGVAFYSFASHFTNINIQRFLPYIIFLVASSVVFENLSALLFGINLQKISESIRLILWTLNYSVGIVFVISGLDIKGLLWAYSFALIVAIFIAVFQVHAKIGFNVQISLHEMKRYFIRLISFGKWVIACLMVAELLYNSDVLMVNYFLGSEQTGLYKAALIPTTFVWFVPRIIQMAIMPSFSNYWSNKRIDFLTSVSAKAFRYIYLLVILLAGGLFVLASQFVTVYYGKSYLPSALPIQILLIGTIGFSISRIYDPILLAGEGLKLSFVCSGSALVLNVLLNLFLIPKYGIVGAAIGTSMAYATILITKVFVTKKYLQVDLIERLPTNRLISLSIFYIIILFSLKKIIPQKPLLQLILIAIIGFCSFAFIVLKLRLIDNGELIILRRFPLLKYVL